MTTTDRELFDVGLGKVFSSLLCNIHTAMPGEVVSFDPLTQTATVQPELQRLLEGADAPESISPIEDVPVAMPGGGNFWINLDIQPGDTGIIIWSERSIANWLNQGGQVDPDDSRKFDLSDAMFIPGINPLPGVLVPPLETGSLILRNKTGTVKITMTDTDVTIENIYGKIELTSSTLKLSNTSGGTVEIKSSGQVAVNGTNLTVDL
jgi:hypothetical protein